MDLTVCIPAYNAMPFLPEAVESVLRQTYKRFSFLIIDDGSTDGTAKYLDTIRGAAPHLSVIRQENRGLGATLNRSIQMCQTKYYARMDADDVMQPERLARQMQFLLANPDVVLVGTAVDFIAAKRTLPGSRPPVGHDDIIATLMKGHSGVVHPSIVFDATVADKIGGYRISGSGEDVDFCLRMCEQGRAANLSDVLHQLRIHEGSITFRDQSELRRGYDFARVCAMCRRKGEAEPNWDQFAQEWSGKRSLADRIRDHIEASSTRLYRRGLIALGSGRPFLGSARIAVAAAMRPGAVTRRLRSRGNKPDQSRLLGNTEKHAQI